MDPLADVLDLSRVLGAVMAQLIAHEPWGVDVDPRAGAVFHAVVSGSCWLRMSGRPPVHLMPGDVVLLPTNTPHALASDVDADTLPFGPLERQARRTADGDVLIDGPGARTRVLCAYYDYDHDVAHPLMSQLPPALLVPADAAGGDGAVAATLGLLALELGGRPPGSRAAVARLIDVMLIHVMRAWQRAQTATEDGCWLVALRDPVVAGALARIHAQPGASWTVDSLAAAVNVSRATLARRFTALVGESPLAYLTRWRMDIAAQRLRDSDDSIGVVADHVGYRSEYAFSRASRDIAAWRQDAYRSDARQRRARAQAA